MIRIEFDTDNAAFEEDKHWEIVRILKAICQQIEELRDPPCIITDRNGNTIGTVEITQEVLGIHPCRICGRLIEIKEQPCRLCICKIFERYTQRKKGVK